jgi:hypothetical protein
LLRSGGLCRLAEFRERHRLGFNDRAAIVLGFLLSGDGNIQIQNPFVGAEMVSPSSVWN